jgi:hypothetical protein
MISRTENLSLRTALAGKKEIAIKGAAARKGRSVERPAFAINRKRGIDGILRQIFEETATAMAAR